eukprot:CAMPEP_0204600234 /NCGR_PEP_ID=MMETSP0661-20131031/55320_1 /ASSEMBLY_ACC=CAM_ASM_000606 /TAXON_ID=109239 /ORGANISM="Alexandrium margalefi, Strain AMGDE01CS-322" /LENGTH=62 /DNA_ID=CAMNT_0051611025 /DNA_START=23 /DNA_END=207 /DNA_ORIENTATION=+
MAPCVATIFGCLRYRKTRSSLQRSASLPAQRLFMDSSGDFTATNMPQNIALRTIPKPPWPTT